MKIYEIIACSRSGHHSMVNWIFLNKIGFQYDWEYKYVRLGNSGMYYLNEGNHDIPLSFRYIDESVDSVDTLFVGYEDTPWDYTIFSNDNKFNGPMSLRDYSKYNMDYQNRVVFIRNFYSNLASRIKSNENKVLKKWNDNLHLLEVTDKFIYRWKSQARACVENKVNYLRFEDWLNNKEIREKFLYDTFGLKDIFGTKNVEGTRSSFGDRTNVMNRHNELDLPEETKELIRKDGELHYLMGALGYEYKQI